MPFRGYKVILVFLTVFSLTAGAFAEPKKVRRKGVVFELVLFRSEKENLRYARETDSWHFKISDEHLPLRGWLRWRPSYELQFFSHFLSRARLADAERSFLTEKQSSLVSFDGVLSNEPVTL